MGNLTDAQVRDWVFARFNEGVAHRRTGAAPKPQASGDSLIHCLRATGWVHEDLRLALKDASPGYRAQQEAFGQ